MLKALRDYLLEKFPLNRVVALTTIVITPFAAGIGGSVSAWLADHLPLVAEQFGGTATITAAFVTGAVTASGGLVTMAYIWMKGWQLDEDRIWSAANQLAEPPDGVSAEAPGADLERAQADVSAGK